MAGFLRRILVVEDDPLLGSLLTRALGQEAFEAQCATTALAEKKIKDWPDHVLLLSR